MAARSAIASVVPDSKNKYLKIIWLATFLFCIFFVLYPLLKIFPAVSTENWSFVLTSPRWQKAILNTLMLTVCSTTLSVLVGFLYAYAVTRAEIPFKKFFSVLPMVRLITPPFVGGLAFILLFGRQGVVTQQIFRADISLYGFFGLLLAQTFCFFPVAFLILKGTLENINTEQEQAAFSMGASRFYVFRTVTLPLCLPGLLSAALFIALSVLSDFGNPMLIGGRFRVLAVEVYTQLAGWVNVGTSACLGMVLLVPALLLFFVQRAISKNKREQVATLNGRGHLPPVRKPPILVRILLTIFCSVISVLTIAHFIVLVYGAFSNIWGVDHTPTTSHITQLLRYRHEIANSLSFAFCAAIIAPTIAAFCAFFTSRTKFPFHSLLEILATITAAVPDPLIGLAYVLAFNSLFGGAVKLTGTKAVIILSMVVLYLPVCYRMMSGAFAQIKTTLDDSVLSLGGSKLHVFCDVLFPLALKNFFAAFMFSFIRATGTMGAVIFLISFKTQLVSVNILNLAEQGNWGVASALAVALSVATFLIIGMINLILFAIRKSLRQIRI